MSSYPAPAGYRMPAEWERQEALWLSWPLNPKTWPDTKDKVERAMAQLAAAVSLYQKVYINYVQHDLERVRDLIECADAQMDRIRFFPIATNDAWIRDHGPIFLKHDRTGKLAILDWQYNAWGGKFPPWDLDDQVPMRIARELGCDRYNVPLVGEGGGVEVNGQGLLITTRSVFLSETRNPDLKPEQVEAMLHYSLGTAEAIWLEGGLLDDDTDGHVDTLTRFFNPYGVLTCIDSGGPNEEQLLKNKELLKAYRSEYGTGLDIVDLPLPAPIRTEGWRQAMLPASYANFVIINEAVLVPTYQQPDNDALALEIIQSCFPERSIIPIDCLDIVLEGGALHCLSQQQPV